MLPFGNKHHPVLKEWGCDEGCTRKNIDLRQKQFHHYKIACSILIFFNKILIFLYVLDIALLVSDIHQNSSAE